MPLTIDVLDAHEATVTISTIDALIAAQAGGAPGAPAGDIHSMQGVDGGFPLFVASPAFSSAVSIARPNNSIPYIANGVIGINAGGNPGLAVHVFSGIGPDAGGHVLLTSATLEIDVNGLPLGMTSFRLHLYAATPPSALLDNAPWDLVAGDRSAYRGYIDLGSPADLGSTLYCEVNGINKHVAVPAGGTLFGYLVTNGAYTPGNGTVHFVRMYGIGI